MTPFGDRAVRFAVPGSVSRVALLDRLRAIAGVRDVVLTEEIGCVVYDDARKTAEPEVVRALAAPVSDEAATVATRVHEVPVVYDGEDLDAVASAVGVSRERVVALHSDPTYRVAMLGFLPGFAYLHGLANELRLPRRAPRPRVPSNSVAIAAEYSAVYPCASPGGWHLLGRARDFRAFGEDGATLSTGDGVRFVPSSTDAGAPGPPAPIPSPIPAEPHLEIVRVAGFALVVDGGRFGHMHEGVPPGGPLVRGDFDRANERAGNARGAAAIEVFGTFEVAARGGPVTIADSGRRIDLEEGQFHAISTVGTPHRVAYLAMREGVDVPIVLGSRSSLLLASIGRPLRKGERLRAGDGSVAPAARQGSGDRSKIATEIFVDTLTGGFPDHRFRVSATSDRTGTRLEGPAIDLGSPDRRSTPMVLGAIELTPSGLIVLGPDHPTTGGYPVVGVVRSDSLDTLFSKKPGDEVRFVCEGS